ncbi:TonB-dependent receptor [Flavihumibacter petaseus]|uniref:Putative TonB-dependent receptor n=1 Tax=Flavihumibacter petaseus NBRC 106054 TaxID=1220578 RepID=A0A0E9N3P4_9BACT|nr:TonB-dependent receptor [Flavihumibacter petaseus]GAO44398.1 putative TonB-dependent receptor [Flavihumibacter petaseus NBRC 106054]
MKRTLTTLLFSFFCFTLFAQAPGGMAAGRGAAGGMNIGRFYGRIVDASNNKGMEAVSVQLFQSKFDTLTKKRKDTLVNGMLTDKRGEFSFEGLAVAASYRLKVSAIGFKVIDQKVGFEFKPGGDMSKAMNAVDKDLGNVKLTADPQTLENVTVTGSKPTVSAAIDRKVFNVEKNLNSTGGTAVDVMKNVPSLQVDLDGNVTLRNSSPQIYVDGRPSTLTLEQIPADAISSVEVITNPSAKFDASGGTSGILNIVLKKNKKVGYSGNLRAGIDMRAQPNAGGDINVRQNKLNLFASGNYGQRKSISMGETERLSVFDKPNTILNQYDKNTNKGYFAFGRFGADYFIDNRNTLSASMNLVKGEFKPNTISDIYIDTLLEGSKPESYSQRNSNTVGNFRNLGATLGFKHNFAKAGREWTADMNFNQSKNENHNDIFTTTQPVSGSTEGMRTFRQLQDGSGTNQFMTIQTDFVNPLTETAKLEMGLRAQFRNVDNENILSQQQADGNIIKIPQLSSRYKNDDQVYAGYLSFSNKYKKLGYQVGLRAESSSYQGTVYSTSVVTGKDSTSTFSNSFPISLFPSVFLNYDLGNDQSLQFSYTRRVNRPNFFQLFPFTDYSDSLNLNRGNPDLRPEFTNSMEMSYQKNFENNSNILASVYLKQTDNQITRVQKVETNPVTGKEVLINTYENANSSYVGGLELTAKINMKKWWELTPNVNLYTSKINYDDPTVAAQDNIYSYFIKINNNFKLPKNFTIQLSGEYTSKTILPPGGSGGGGGRFSGGGFMGGPSSSAQGYVEPNYFVDMSVRYEFLKNRTAAITLSWSDIFRTRIYQTHSESAYFVQDASRRRDPQMFRVNFSWRFGKFDTALFKRKNVKGEMQNMQNMNESSQF